MHDHWSQIRFFFFSTVTVLAALIAGVEIKVHACGYQNLYVCGVASMHSLQTQSVVTTLQAVMPRCIPPCVPEWPDPEEVGHA